MREPLRRQKPANSVRYSGKPAHGWVGLLIACALIGGLPLHAQQPPAPPAPPAPAEVVRITFLPPPLEGTLSAGVYSADGKLVRTLARDATESDFTVGLNGLITHWDGKDDAGRRLPAGKYFVRGYSVAAFDVEGIAFYGNDWLSEDDNVPRVTDIAGIQVDGSELLVAGRCLGASDCVIHISRKSAEMKFDVFDRTALPGGDANVRFTSHAARSLAMKSSTAASGNLKTSAGKDGTVWKIENGTADPSSPARVLQRSADGATILRALELLRDEPQPTAVAAAPDRDEIYLLERNSTQIRVRGMRLKKTESTSGGKAVSEWELVLTKSIRLFPGFAQFASHLTRTPPPQAVEKLRITLMANELLPVAPAAVQIGIGFDEKGSFLQTGEGLPLRRITDTPHLRWVTLAAESDGTATVFQGDGAVVEEYRLRKLDRMMAFEAGEYELTAPR